MSTLRRRDSLLEATTNVDMQSVKTRMETPIHLQRVIVLSRRAQQEPPISNGKEEKDRVKKEEKRRHVEDKKGKAKGKVLGELIHLLLVQEKEKGRTIAPAAVK